MLLIVRMIIAGITLDNTNSYYERRADRLVCTNAQTSRSNQFYIMTDILSFYNVQLQAWHLNFPISACDNLNHQNFSKYSFD